MNTEPGNISVYSGIDKRIFTRATIMPPELKRLKEQAFTTTCQEIVDLYNMLQYKRGHVEQQHELAH